MYQKRNQKRNGKMKKKIEKRNQEEEEEDWEEEEEEQEEEIRRGLSDKGMSVVALLKTRLSPLTDYWFTVYRWMEDGRYMMGKTTTENKNLNGNLHVEKRWVRNSVHPKLTNIKDDKIDRFT
jgi:hypothetical protein